MDTNSLILTLLNLNSCEPKKVYNYVIKHSFNYDKCIEGLDQELSIEAKQNFKFELQKFKETLQKNFDNRVKAIYFYITKVT